MTNDSQQLQRRLLHLQNVDQLISANILLAFTYEMRFITPQTFGEHTVNVSHIKNVTKLTLKYIPVIQLTKPNLQSTYEHY